MEEIFGLYNVDDTKKLALSGYANSESVDPWKRTKLLFQGLDAGHSIKETNNFGAYISGNRLFISGQCVAISSMSNPTIHYEDDGAYFGEVRLCTPNTAINITKENYIKLRNGELVEGYAKYNEYVPYYLTDDITVEPPHFSSEFKQEDIIVNSFDGSLQDNEPGDENFTDVRVPSLAMRYFNPIIKKGKSLELHYFVDTYDYDSIHKRHREGIDGQTILLDDTFTVVVKDKDGNVVYTATTYAGEFRCKTSKFNTAGQTYISIQCIDSHHRCSPEYFYDVLVEDVDNRPMFEIGPNTLTEYGIQINTGRDNLLAGAKNKQGFKNLIASLGNDYKGIKLYNEGNTNYYFDHHPNVGTIESPVLSGINNYYLLYYDKDSNKLYGVTENGLTTNPITFPNNASDSDVYNAIDAFKIQEDRIFKIGQNTYTVDSDPIEWLLHDGAHIYRDVNDDILVAWGIEEGATGEVMYKEAVVDDENSHDYDEDEEEDDTPDPSRYLRTRVLNKFIKTGADDKKFVFEGYYYCCYIPQAIVNAGLDAIAIDDFIRLPDNFTIDLNGATVRLTDCSDLQVTPPIFNLVYNTNVHIKNGKIIGVYDIDETGLSDIPSETARQREIYNRLNRTLKVAYLRQGRKGTKTVWEGAPTIGQAACRFCTVEDVELVGGGGYENTFRINAGVRGVEKGSTSVFCNYNPPNSGYTKDTALGFNTLCSDNDSILELEDYFVSGVRDVVDNHGNPYLGSNTVELVATDGYFDLTQLQQKFKLKDVVLGEPDTEKDMYDGTIAIGNHMTVAYRIGAYPYLFILFYTRTGEATNYTYTFNSMVKTVPFTQVKVPSGANAIKIIGYGWCGSDSIDRLDMVAIAGVRLTSAGIYKNCEIHRTRSIAANGIGCNIGFIDCKFYDIQDVLANMNITPMLWDMEENHSYGDLAFMLNCTCKVKKGIKGRNNTQSVLRWNSKFVHIENCKGLGYSGQIYDARLANSTFGICRIHNLARGRSRHQGIIKHCVISSIGEFKYYTSHNHDSTLYNSCVEDVTKYITVNDCFYKHCNSNTTQMLPADYSRTQKADKDTLFVFERHNEVITENVIKPGYFSWDFITTSLNEKVQVGYGNREAIRAGDLLLDGESVNTSDNTVLISSAGSVYLKVPTPGMHIIHIKLAPYIDGNGITRPATRKNNRLHVFGYSFLVIPEDANETYEFNGETFTNKYESTVINTLDVGCTIMCLSPTPIKLADTRIENKDALANSNVILIPPGTKDAYLEPYIADYKNLFVNVSEKLKEEQLL